MQHQYWITKQTLSRKFGKKEDECIVSSDAQLDSKLELFRNIQISCTLIQRIIDKYQESICYLSQETNSMGRFLKENGEEDQTCAGEIMLAMGKCLVFCAQQQLLLHDPLIRLYQELETFRQRAIGDTLQNVLIMEKARTEYRAALSWMKNISQQLDPDTSKQLEKFKKVQDQVRRGKINFDKLSFDCLQKVDLLAAARCNMLNHTLSFYQNKFINYTEKSAKTYLVIFKSFNNQNHNTILETGDNKLSNTRSIDSITANSDSNIEVRSKMSLESEKIATSLVNTMIADENLSFIQCEQNVDFNELQNYKVKEFCNAEEQLFSCKPLQKSQSNLLLQNNDIIKENIISETKYLNAAKIEDNENFFLPSALLKESFNSVTPKLKEDNKLHFSIMNHMEQYKNHQTKSWINLFKELDPLSSNPIDKNFKSKNSFV